MKKEEELSNPRSCLNKAMAGEMLFTLIARDMAAPATIRYWVGKRIEMGLNLPDDAQVKEALACAETMERQRAAYFDRNR